MDNQCCNDDQQEGCCAQGGDCCPTSTSSSMKGQPGRRGWKIAIFTIVMLVVVGLIAYSILTYETDAVAPTPLKTTEVSADPVVPSNTLSIPDSGQLTSIEYLDDAFGYDYDFVLVVISGSDNNLNMEVSRCVTEVAAKIQAQDTKTVGMFATSTNDPKSTNPSVLVSRRDGADNKYGNRCLVTGDINETKLLQAYLGICGGSSSSCCPTSTPGNSSSCCP